VGYADAHADVIAFFEVLRRDLLIWPAIGKDLAILDPDYAAGYPGRARGCGLMANMAHGHDVLEDVGKSGAMDLGYMLQCPNMLAFASPSLSFELMDGPHHIGLRAMFARSKEFINAT
jgi:hypothetical protein